MAKKVIAPLLLLIVLVISACSNTPLLTNSSAITFYSDLPVVVSNVWDDGTDTYITPIRKNGIDDVLNMNGSVLPILATGSYFKVPGVHSALNVSINGELFVIKK